jgi:DNA-binding FadR family transcriptional regulator
MVETLHSVIDGTAAGVRYTTKRRIAIMGAHERIVTALRSRDPDASERAMTDHLIDTGRFWRKRYGYLYGRPVGQSNG